MACASGQSLQNNATNNLTMGNYLWQKQTNDTVHFVSQNSLQAATWTNLRAAHTMVEAQTAIHTYHGTTGLWIHGWSMQRQARTWSSSSSAWCYAFPLPLRSTLVYVTGANHKKRKKKRKRHEPCHTHCRHKHRRTLWKARRYGKARHKHPRNFRRREANRQTRLRKLFRKTRITRQMVRNAQFRPQYRNYSIWTNRLQTHYKAATFGLSWVGGAGGAATTRRRRQHNTTTDITLLEAVEAVTRTIRMGILEESGLAGALQRVLALHGHGCTSREHRNGRWQPPMDVTDSTLATTAKQYHTPSVE